MYYKLFIEEGDFIDNSSGERRNIMEVNHAETPNGPNVGWDWFDSSALAYSTYNVTYSPLVEDVSIVEPAEPTVEELQAQLAALQASNSTLQTQVDALIKENSNQV